MPELDRTASHQLDGPADLSAAGIDYIVGSGRQHEYVVANCPSCDNGNMTLRVPKRRARGLGAWCEDGCAVEDIVLAVAGRREQLREPSWFPAAGPLRDRTLGVCVEREIAPCVQSAVERELALQAAQRASLECDEPDWWVQVRDLPDEELWHSEDELREGFRLRELGRRLDAGRELHPVQLHEVLDTRRKAAQGARRIADYPSRYGLRDDDVLLDEIAARDERAYRDALHAWRPRRQPPATRRRARKRRAGGRPRGRRRRRAQARAPDDDGDGSSEPPGVAGRRDPLDPRPASPIGAGAAC